jgi:hypothetical protein
LEPGMRGMQPGMRGMQPGIRRMQPGMRWDKEGISESEFSGYNLTALTEAGALNLAFTTRCVAKCGSSHLTTKSLH